MEKKVYTFELNSAELLVIAQALFDQAYKQEKYHMNELACVSKKLGSEFHSLYLNTLDL